MHVHENTNAPLKNKPIHCHNYVRHALYTVKSWGPKHTTYSRNNICQKCGGDCGLWVLDEIILKIYPENMKKIMVAILELPAK